MSALPGDQHAPTVEPESPNLSRPSAPTADETGGNIDVGSITSGQGVAIGHGATAVNIENSPNAHVTITWLAQPEQKAPTEHKSFEPEMILIPSGEFWMGSDDGPEIPDNERPPHAVNLPAFYIARYPITQAQYCEFIEQTKSPVPPELGWVLAGVGHQPAEDRKQHPVVGITWDDAIRYCEWLSRTTERRYRLPSEAEWEKAAGWDSTRQHKRRYPWSDDFDPQCCNSAERATGGTTRVGQYSPQGDSAYGCSDMSGNVWEWTTTIWGGRRDSPQFRYPYRRDDLRDALEPARPAREMRVCRGGSYLEPAARVTCTARSPQWADSRSSQRGFRVALEN